MASHLRVVTWRQDPGVGGPAGLVAHTVSVPILTFSSAPWTVDKADLREASTRELIEARLHDELNVELDRLGYRVIEGPKLHERELLLRNQVEFRMVARVHDHWEDGTWSSARAAWTADQAWMQRPVNEEDP